MDCRNKPGNDAEVERASQYFKRDLVAATGLEPVRSVRAADFKSAVYTNFTTRPAGLHPRRMLVSKPTVYALPGAKWQG